MSLVGNKDEIIQMKVVMFWWIFIDLLACQINIKLYNNFVKIFKILLSIFVVLCLGLFFMLSFFWDDKDACLDSGWCKEGMQVNNENGCFIVNEKSCIQNNGIWKPNKKVCHFKTLTKKTSD